MSISNFVWPTVVQGVGMGLIFPTLAGAALSSVSRENMGYAASFFSMVRNIGASIGTSTLTTYLTHLETDPTIVESKAVPTPVTTELPCVTLTVPCAIFCHRRFRGRRL